jgi:hypothetical protein
MKHILPSILASAMLMLPVAVRADEPNGPPPPPMMNNPAAFQAMEQAHAKMQQLHSQARLAMLNSLSAGQRATLAQIVGQLAIAPTPDATAAAKQIDASLSPAQAKNILSISTSLHQQAEQIMQSVHKQMMSSMPAAHGQMMMKTMHPENDQEDNDPGMILLETVLHAGGHGEFHHMAGAAFYIQR